MAEIFKGKAVDLHGIERIVVIKRILPHIAASPEFVEMLIDEAKIAVMLSHGNIAQIFDLGKVADDYFIVMEYVEGKTLSQIMKRLRSQGKLMPISHAIQIVAEVANALDYMHRKTDDRGNHLGIIHRDISPQNVILSTSGTIKIIDFGIAKAATKISTTDSGILKGKFAYMSPEHAEGEKLDYRTDIFSLGIILSELLTGQRLFKGKNNPETIRRVKRAKVPIPSGMRSSISKELDEIVLKALQKDRNKRYLSAVSFSQDLTRLLIRHYPEFSPRDLVFYLREIFPELAPTEITGHEETEKGPLVIEESSHNNTFAADSDVIRSKLKEAEVFDVPKKEKPDEPKKSEEQEEATTRIPVKRIAKGVTVAVSLGILLAIGIYATQRRMITILQPPPPVPKSLSPIPQPAPPSPVPKPRTPLPQPPAPVVVPSFGTIVVDSKPKGAHIFLNDVDSNRTTPAVLEKISLGSAQKIGLSLDRHKFWERKVQVEAGETFKMFASLEVNYGDLAINSLPAGAEVILNGRSVGKTPYHLNQLVPDTLYEVILRQDGYETWHGQVKIFGGKTEMVNVSLKRASH